MILRINTLYSEREETWYSYRGIILHKWMPLVYLFYLFKIYFIDYAITVVPFPPPFIPLCSAHPVPPTSPSFSSCSWVIHTSSLASTFPILFLTSPCLFSIYHLCYLFSVPFPPFSPFHSPTDNPPCDVHFCDSVPVLVVCLFCFCFCFRCGC